MSIPTDGTNPDHEAVYAAVRAIPAGKVITYTELALAVGRPSSHARAVANILGNRPDNDAWMSTAAADHDVPWWRVVKADGTLLSEQDDETGDRRRWIDWAKGQLVAEGVAFTNDGRVASLASRRSSGGSSGGRRSRAKVDTTMPYCTRCRTRHHGFTCPW